MRTTSTIPCHTIGSAIDDLRHAICNLECVACLTGISYDDLKVIKSEVRRLHELPAKCRVVRASGEHQPSEN